MGCGLRVVSLYSDDTPLVVKDRQREVFDHFDVQLEQCRTSDGPGFLNNLVKSDFSLLLIFDAYTVPLCNDFIRIICCFDPYNRLVGLRQPGFGEWTVGLGFMALSSDVYNKIGRPSFYSFGSGVAGQRLTRNCRVNDVGVRFLPGGQLVYRNSSFIWFCHKCDGLLLNGQIQEEDFKFINAEICYEVGKVAP